jgi:sulfoxide reductase heme-binding subunit YedZ
LAPPAALSRIEAAAGALRVKTVLTHRLAKPVIFLLCLAPLMLLLYRWQTGQLGVNRIETVARFTGNCTIRLLLLTLGVTPLRRIPGLGDLIRFRRMLGLFAFFYGSLHFLHYLWIDKGWNWEIIWEDLRLRRFYIMGWTAYLGMIPLALTSSAAAVRALGGKRWLRLHRLVYASAAAGVIHYYWQDKIPAPESLIYARILAVLLAVRLAFFLKRIAGRRVPSRR